MCPLPPSARSRCLWKRVNSTECQWFAGSVTVCFVRKLQQKMNRRSNTHTQRSGWESHVCMRFPHPCDDHVWRVFVIRLCVKRLYKPSLWDLIQNRFYIIAHKLKKRNLFFARVFLCCVCSCNSFMGNSAVQKKPQSKPKKTHPAGHKGGSSSREPQPKRLEEVYNALKQGLEWVRCVITQRSVEQLKCLLFQSIN